MEVTAEDSRLRRWMKLIQTEFKASRLRRTKVILTVAVLATFSGFLISFLFTPKYTSQSKVLVEAQKISEDYVKPVIIEDPVQRIATLEQKVLSRSHLLPMVEHLNLAKHGRAVDDVIEQIQQSVTIEPLKSDLDASASASKGSGQSTSSVPGFTVSYTGDNPGDAQMICSELTTMLLDQNLMERREVVRSTVNFLQKQVEEAKHILEDMDAKVAVFKEHHLGNLPNDADSNLKTLAGLTAQLDADTQALNRAQQDRAYTESVLAAQLAAGKTSQSNDTSAKATDTANGKESTSEPPEIRQLRLQIHQYDNAITQATFDQKRLLKQIDLLQGRVINSPNIDEQYTMLTRDYDSAEKTHADLLGKLSQAQVAQELETQGLGEQMRLVSAATLPDAPDFPNRFLFALGGLGTGLLLGFGLALWPAPQSKAIASALPAVTLQPQPESPQPVSLTEPERPQELTEGYHNIVGGPINPTQGE